MGGYEPPLKLEVMNKLELKHLVPYLPYNLKCKVEGEEPESDNLMGVEREFEGEEIYGLFDEFCSVELSKVKPILRPLSLYQDINGDEMRDLNCDLMTQIEIQDFASQYRSIQSISYGAYSRLIEAKVDVFGLIEKGFAVDATKVEGGS